MCPASISAISRAATVVVSTHLVEDVGAACPEVVLMDAGHISSHVMTRAAVSEFRRGTAEDDVLRHPSAPLWQAACAHVLDQVGVDTTTVAAWPRSRSKARNTTRRSGSRRATVGSVSEQQQVRVVHDRLRDPDPAQHAAGCSVRSLAFAFGSEVNPLHSCRYGFAERDPAVPSLSSAKYSTNSVTVQRRGSSRGSAAGSRGRRRISRALCGVLRVPVQQPDLAG